MNDGGDDSIERSARFWGFEYFRSISGRWNMIMRIYKLIIGSDNLFSHYPF